MAEIRSVLGLFVKNEENDILEWICHHALVGFDRIVVYDNRSTDDTAREVHAAMAHFPVHHVVWDDAAHPVPGLSKQGAAYAHCIAAYRDAEWMCFLDADEFLIPPPDRTLGTLLDAMAGQQAFAINWLCFGSGGLDSTGDRLVLEAFTRRGPCDAGVNQHVKMFFRPGSAGTIANPHFVATPRPCVDLRREPVRWSTPGITEPDAVLHAEWRLHHYIIRSREHWERRLARGQPSGVVRDWNTFGVYDRGDVEDGGALASAAAVANRLRELGLERRTAGRGAPPPPSAITCFVDEASALFLRGWACDPAKPEPVELVFLADGEPFERLTCAEERPDVRTTAIGRGEVGFRTRIPRRFLDGRNHDLTIAGSDGQRVRFFVSGKSVDRITFNEQAPPEIIGQIDQARDGALHGWLATSRDPYQARYETRCHILVSLHNRPIGTCVADVVRPDVAAAHSIDSRCGFIFPVPAELRREPVQTLRVFLLPEMIELRGSPITVDFGNQDQVGRSVRLAGVLTDARRCLEGGGHAGDDELCRCIELAVNLSREMIPRQGFTVLNYAAWYHHHQEVVRARHEARPPEPGPLVSVVCPVFRPRQAHLRTALRSVVRQSHANIELLLCDDGGGDPGIVAMIEAFADSDPRIRYVISPRNEGISAATNRCLEMAAGEWIAFFDHDDLLAEHAVARMLAHAGTDTALIYSDEDKILDDGDLLDPAFKPDWSYRYLLGVNYINHLTMIRTSLVRELGGLRPAFDGAQDHDLLLRCAEQLRPEQIVHVPEVLYHWRSTAGSTAATVESKPYAIDAGVRAVRGHLERRGVAAEVSSLGRRTMYRVRPRSPRRERVAVIIPFRDQMHHTRRCVEHLRRHPSGHDLEIILVNNNSAGPDYLAFREALRDEPDIRMIDYDGPFNYSRINNAAVATTDADYVVLMNNDLFVTHPDWLDIMLGEMVLDPAVAAVGGKFLYENRTIQHCGVVLGLGGVAGHAFTHESEHHPGYGGRALLAHEVSAVTAACMLVRRDAFLAVGGLDERHLRVAFNDIDLCLKLARAGHKIVLNPDFVAEHHESVSRGLEDSPEKIERFNREVRVMTARWGRALTRDRFYSPSMSLTDRAFFDLVVPAEQDATVMAAASAVAAPDRPRRRSPVRAGTAPGEAVRDLIKPTRAYRRAAGPAQPAPEAVPSANATVA